VSEGSAKRIVNTKQFVALLKDADQKKTRVASINGELGERIKDACENGHLHRQLFGLMLKLSRQDELKREDFISQFPVYVDMCREAGIFGQEHVGDLLDGAASEEEPEQDRNEAAAEANTKALEKGIKPLTEEEREFDDSTARKPSRRRQAVSGEGEGNYKVH
jgi:hypothetical protein